MKRAVGLLLAALMLFAALPALLPAAAAEGEDAQPTDTRKGTIVNCSTQVNVREKATQSAKILGKAKKGETFEVKGLSGNWVRIDFNGKDGYVYGRYIKIEGTSEETAVEGKVGKIVNCKTQVNVREKATSLSQLLGNARKGATFKVLATAGNWVKIAFTDDTAGYVYKKYVKITDESGEPTGDRTGKIVNCKTRVNVREKATKDSASLGKAKKGETFKVIGSSGNWIKIEFNGKEGYVFKTYIRVSAQEEPVEGRTGKIDNCTKEVNVRAKATKNSKLLGKAQKGDLYAVLGKSGNWIKIDFNGKTGYVYKRYISFE